VKTAAVAAAAIIRSESSLMRGSSAPGDESLIAAGLAPMLKLTGT
jgi:hypothetical protein